MTETNNKIIEEVKEIIDITSRVDERIKMLGSVQQDINFRLNHFIDEHNTLLARVHVMEMVGSQKAQKLSEEFDSSMVDLNKRLEELEDHKQGAVKRYESIFGHFKHVFGYIWQAIFIISVCYILYRLGLSLPPVP